MMRTIRESSWRGSVGILDHREHLDSEVALRDNLRGLDWVRRELAKPGSGGKRPKLESAAPVAAQPARQRCKGFGRALGELYSYAGAGDFSVFLPGQGGEVRSRTPICDDAWHHLAMVLEKERVRLFVDGKLVKEHALPAPLRAPVPGDVAIGRTVEEGAGCDGLIDDVRISRGAREIIGIPDAALAKDDATLGLWPLDELPKTTAATLPEREPLDPAARPLHTHPINRDRLVGGRWPACGCA